MIEVTITGAVLAGLLSFLSPCVLPLVPAYLSYISGVSVDALRSEDVKLHRRALVQSLWFVAGFSLVFIALGASATLIGQWLISHLNVLGKIAGIIIFVFGLHYIGIIRIPWLMYEAHIDTSGVASPHGVGALVLGAAFAFGWTPCVGPILGAILAVAGAQDRISEGVILLTAYSAGLALPFLLAATITDRFIRWMRDFSHHLHTVERISGILLMLVGALIFLGSFGVVSSWMLEAFPFLANIEGVLSP